MFLPFALVLSLPLGSFTPLPQDSEPAGVARSLNVAILVYEGVELLDFAGPGEVFAAAHGASRRPFRVFTVAKTREPVHSQGFVQVTPGFSIEDCPAPDLLVVPGGNVPDEDEVLVGWVRDCADSAELVMSVCNGAFLLAEAGLLDGLEITSHHGSLQSLTARYPETRVLTNRRFVDNGRVMTCAGVSAGIDGALHVVERLLGDEAARRTAGYMEYDWRPEEIAAQLTEPGRTLAEGAGAGLAQVAREEGLQAALAAYNAQTPRLEESQLLADGSMLSRIGKPAEARALLELAVAVFPESPLAHAGLSEACERLGDDDAALRHGQSALAQLESSDLTPARAERIRNAVASRLVRLGQGDRKTLRYGCPPCGAGCDEPRYVAPGPCPGCSMAMVAVDAGG